eukprot:s3847_g3.t1
MAENTQDNANFGHDSLRFGKGKFSGRRHSTAHVPGKESAEGRRKSISARRSSLRTGPPVLGGSAVRVP